MGEASLGSDEATAPQQQEQRRNRGVGEVLPGCDSGLVHYTSRDSHTAMQSGRKLLKLRAFEAITAGDVICAGIPYKGRVCLAGNNRKG